MEPHAQAPLGRLIATDEACVIEPGPSDASTLRSGLGGPGHRRAGPGSQGARASKADSPATSREANPALVWSAKQRHRRTGLPVRDPGSVSGNGAVESIANRDTDPGASPSVSRIRNVIAAVRNYAERPKAACRDVAYFSDIRARTEYSGFRATGLCVVSGVVAGGCRNIVDARLRQGCMRRTVKGANAIIALHCAAESNRVDGVRERHARART